MNTKQFEKQLKKEKAKLEHELHKVSMTLQALAILTGKRVATAAGPLKKRAYKQSAKARKAIGAAKKLWWKNFRAAKAAKNKAAAKG
jgi:hypothetical protein